MNGNLYKANVQKNAIKELNLAINFSSDACVGKKSTTKIYTCQLEGKTRKVKIKLFPTKILCNAKLKFLGISIKLRQKDFNDICKNTISTSLHSCI
jgi:hypothetical protein